MRVPAGLLTLLLLSMSSAGLNLAGPVRLVVTPGDVLIAPSSQQQFKATISYIGGFGKAAAQRDVSSVAHWSSSDETIASVDLNGLVMSKALTGTTSITAALGPLHVSVPLTVSNATLSSIAVSPPSATVPLGRKQQLAATGKYSDASQHDLTTAVTWSSDASSVASVDFFGNVATHAKGPANVTATLGSRSGSAALTVTDPALDTLVVSPPNAVIIFPATLQMSAIGIFSDGSTQDETGSVTWASSNSVAVAIDSKGLMTSKEAGVSTIAGKLGVTGATQVTVTGLPLGTVTSSTSITCPAIGLTGSCYSLNVSCPGIADENVLIKVFAANGTPKGTVVFIGGGGSSGGFFDYPESAGGYPFGQLIVSSVTQNGFTGASLNFNDPLSEGWLAGPGGMRLLACRPATTINWVYQNIHQANTAAPLCGASVSGGSTAFAESLSHYGLGPILSMVEATGGPPLTRMDHGCACDVPPNIAGPCNGPLITNCYASDVLPIVDGTYSAPVCTITSAGNTSNIPVLLHDSVLDGPDVLFSFSKTDVHVVLGGGDKTTAVPEGVQWEQSITTTKTLACAPTAGHAFPRSLDGANQIINDIQNFCKLQ